LQPHTEKKITTIEKFFDKMKNKQNFRPIKIIVTPFGLKCYETTANHPTAAVLPPHALQLHPKQYQIHAHKDNFQQL